IATSVTLTVSLVVTVMGAFALDTSLVEDDIVANAAPLYGVDVVSANCPDAVSALTTTSFPCPAFDSSGGAYLVEVELTDDGYLSWELQLWPRRVSGAARGSRPPRAARRATRRRRATRPAARGSSTRARGPGRAA